MNRGSLRTQAADFCGDKNQTRYSATQYNTAINRAQEQFSLDSNSTFKDVPYSNAAGDATEALPSDFIVEDWVKYDGIEIDPISRHELQRLSGQDWTDDTGTPEKYIIDPEEARKTITLYPIPVDSKTLVMRYLALPAELSADSDTPLNSSALLIQFHIGIAAYVAWLLLLGEQMSPQVREKRDSLLVMYNDSVNKAIEKFGNTKSMGIRIRGSRIWR